LQGEQPPIERLLCLHNMLTGCTTELRQPINLEQQLLQTSGDDSEVAASMVQLLQVSVNYLLTATTPAAITGKWFKV